MSTQILDEIDAEESFVIAFDFASELFGSTVQVATVSAACAAGTDAAPQELLVGSPSIVGADVLQLVAGRNNGNTYKLRCVAQLANGQKRVRAALLPVREA